LNKLTGESVQATLMLERKTEERESVLEVMSTCLVYYWDLVNDKT